MHENDEPISKADQVEDVDKAPAEPGDEPAKLDFAEHSDGFLFADGGHGSFIEVGERGAGRFGEPLSEEAGYVISLLDSNGGKCGEGSSFFIHRAGGVPKDKHFWVAWDI